MSYHTPKPIKHLRVNTVGKSVAVDHHKEQASLEEINQFYTNTIAHLLRRGDDPTLWANTTLLPVSCCSSDLYICNRLSGNIAGYSPSTSTRLHQDSTKPIEKHPKTELAHLNRFCWLMAVAIMRINSQSERESKDRDRDEGKEESELSFAILSDIKEYLDVFVLPLLPGEHNPQSMASMRQIDFTWLVVLLDGLARLPTNPSTNPISNNNPNPNTALLQLLLSYKSLIQCHLERIILGLLQNLNTRSIDTKVLSATVCCLCFIIHYYQGTEEEGEVSRENNSNNNSNSNKKKDQQQGTTNAACIKQILVPSNISQLIRLCLSKAVYPTMGGGRTPQTAVASKPTTSKAAESSSSSSKRHRSEATTTGTAATTVPTNANDLSSDWEVVYSLLGLTKLLQHPVIMGMSLNTGTVPDKVSAGAVSNNSSSGSTSRCSPGPLLEVATQLCANDFARKWSKRLHDAFTALLKKHDLPQPSLTQLAVTAINGGSMATELQLYTHPLLSSGRSTTSANPDVNVGFSHKVRNALTTLTSMAEAARRAGSSGSTIHGGNYFRHRLFAELLSAGTATKTTTTTTTAATTAAAVASQMSRDAALAAMDYFHVYLSGYDQTSSSLLDSIDRDKTGEEVGSGRSAVLPRRHYHLEFSADALIAQSACRLGCHLLLYALTLSPSPPLGADTACSEPLSSLPLLSWYRSLVPQIASCQAGRKHFDSEDHHDHVNSLGLGLGLGLVDEVMLNESFPLFYTLFRRYYTAVIRSGTSGTGTAATAVTATTTATAAADDDDVRLGVKAAITTITDLCRCYIQLVAQSTSTSDHFPSFSPSASTPAAAAPASPAMGVAPHVLVMLLHTLLMMYDLADRLNNQRNSSTVAATTTAFLNMTTLQSVFSPWRAVAAATDTTVTAVSVTDTPAAADDLPVNHPLNPMDINDISRINIVPSQSQPEHYQRGLGQCFGVGGTGIDIYGGVDNEEEEEDGYPDASYIHSVQMYNTDCILTYDGVEEEDGVDIEKGCINDNVNGDCRPNHGIDKNKLLLPAAMTKTIYDLLSSHRALLDEVLERVAAAAATRLSESESSTSESASDSTMMDASELLLCDTFSTLQWLEQGHIQSQGQSDVNAHLIILLDHFMATNKPVTHTADIEAATTTTTTDDASVIPGAPAVLTTVATVTATAVPAPFSVMTCTAPVSVVALSDRCVDPMTSSSTTNSTTNSPCRAATATGTGTATSTTSSGSSSNTTAISMEIDYMEDDDQDQELREDQDKEISADINGAAAAAEHASGTDTDTSIHTGTGTANTTCLGIEELQEEEKLQQQLQSSVGNTQLEPQSLPQSLPVMNIGTEVERVVNWSLPAVSASASSSSSSSLSSSTTLSSGASASLVTAGAAAVITTSSSTSNAPGSSDVSCSYVSGSDRGEVNNDSSGYKTEIRRLHLALQEHTVRNLRLKQELQGHEMTTRAQEHQIQSLLRENRELQETVVALQGREQGLECEVKEQGRKVEKLEGMLQESYAKLQILARAESVQSTLEIPKLCARIQQLEADLTQSRQACTEANSTVARQTLALEQHTSELLVLQEQQLTAEEEMTSFVHQAQLARLEVCELRKECDLLVTQKNAVLTDIEQLREDKRQLDGELEQAREKETKLVSEVQSVREKLQEAQEETSEVLILKEQIEEELGSVRDQLDEVSIQRDEARATILTLREDKMSLESTLANTRQELSEIQEEHEASMADLRRNKELIALINKMSDSSARDQMRKSLGGEQKGRKGLSSTSHDKENHQALY